MQSFRFQKLLTIRKKFTLKRTLKSQGMPSRGAKRMILLDTFL